MVGGCICLILVVSPVTSCDIRSVTILCLMTSDAGSTPAGQ